MIFIFMVLWINPKSDAIEGCMVSKRETLDIDDVWGCWLGGKVSWFYLLVDYKRCPCRAKTKHSMSFSSSISQRPMTVWSHFLLSITIIIGTPLHTWHARVRVHSLGARAVELSVASMYGRLREVSIDIGHILAWWKTQMYIRTYLAYYGESGAYFQYER